MKYQTKINWAFVSCIFAASCWIIGDIFIAGFEVNPQDYPLFNQTYATKVDIEFATLMLNGSTERLMFGALLAAMTAPFYLPGMWLIYQYFPDKSKWYAWSLYFILIASVVLSPLGHADFFYTGEIYKAIYNTDQIAHTYLLKTASSFQKMLYIAWGSAIIIMLIGCLLFALLVFMGKTNLPRWTSLITPIFLCIYQIPLNHIITNLEVKGYLGAAAFNLSYLIFFLLLLIFFKNRLSAEKSDSLIN